MPFKQRFSLNPFFQADLKQRAHKHHQVRRTRSDLGGQRLLQWEGRPAPGRPMASPPPPRSPRRRPPDAPVVLRQGGRRSGQLRRSLSQPLDIDKLSPLMRPKAAGEGCLFFFVGGVGCWYLGSTPSNSTPEN